MRKKRCYPTRSRANVKNLISVLRLQKFQHESNGCRLGNSLPPSYEKRLIGLRKVFLSFWNEILSIYGQKSANYSRRFEYSASLNLCNKFLHVLYFIFSQNTFCKQVYTRM